MTVSPFFIRDYVISGNGTGQPINFMYNTTTSNDYTVNKNNFSFNTTIMISFKKRVKTHSIKFK